MGKDKFGTKRGRCGACEECYEYMAPTDGKLACEYCDHKPIYHTEVVALGSCGCGNCAGYESTNEYQYNACEYCECSADKHIGYNKVQAELDKVKLRLQETRSGQVAQPKTTESTVANTTQPQRQADTQHQEVGVHMQPPFPPGGQSQNPYGIQFIPNSGIYPTPISMQNPGQQYSPQQQPFGNQMLPNPGQQFPPQQQSYGIQMAPKPGQQFPPQQQSYGIQMAPNPGQQFPPQQQSYGNQMAPNPGQQFSPQQQPHRQTYNIQQSAMPTGCPPPNPYQPYGQAPMPQAAFGMPFSPTGAMPGNISAPYGGAGGPGGFNSNICKSSTCTRNRRPKEDGSGFYDFCGKTCASQAK